MNIKCLDLSIQETLLEPPTMSSLQVQLFRFNFFCIRSAIY